MLKSRILKLFFGETALVYKKKMINGLKFGAVSLFLTLLTNGIVFATNIDECFRLCSPKVGQFAEYQVIYHINHGKENRYRIAIVGKEIVKNKDFFWIKLDMFKNKNRKISFKALVRPLSSAVFKDNPKSYISEGLLVLFKSAERIIVILENDLSYELRPEELFFQPDIFNNTFYMQTPDAKNKTDYSKLKFSKKIEKLNIPAGTFDCYWFGVDTQIWEPYDEEGIDLWRSAAVPFLGIVQMAFSKTKSVEKWDYSYSKLMLDKNWWEKIFIHFFKARVPRDEKYQDTFVMRLTDYGIE
ncbi:MAG: hypothetical protein L6416_08485 [Candidatus Omnitrophica bacterium]|nr:hypothetical protein [Candidatus Omnitrophota bacterium]